MKFSLHLLAVGALGFGLAACGGGSNSVHTTPVAPQTFTQIELLSRPAVKELFEKFVDHQTSNASEPYADTTLQTQIKGLTDALRPPKASVGSDYGAALASILYPNEMTADLSQSGNASYLGVETGGATGGKFGGRKLTDDVVTTSLGIVFGNTISALGLAPDDGNEIPTLTDDHVGPGGKHFIASFPYLGAPQ